MTDTLSSTFVLKSEIGKSGAGVSVYDFGTTRMSTDRVLDLDIVTRDPNFMSHATVVIQLSISDLRALADGLLNAHHECCERRKGLAVASESQPTPKKS